MKRNKYITFSALLLMPIFFTSCAGKMREYDAVYNGYYAEAMQEFNKQAYKQEKYLKKIA